MIKKIILSILIIMLLMISVFTNINNASFSIDSADIYYKANCEYLLKFRGSEIIVEYVLYNNNGVEYPAYCMEREKTRNRYNRWIFSARI